MKLLKKIFFREPSFETREQRQAYELGKDLSKKSETLFRGHCKLSGARSSGEGVFKARLFGMNFAVHALTHALGEDKKPLCEQVYLPLLHEASRRTGLNHKKIRTVSIELLKEQDRALSSEKRNLGAGHFALTAMYAQILESSGCDMKNLAEKSGEPVFQLFGNVITDFVGAWAGFYTAITGKPMQVYTAGFVRTEMDSRRFGDDEV